ncbi:MAG: threonine synthase [Gemmatimonadetes bacterium]|nr:threonine synthase [Gemmatimonadota bacterium]MBT5141120.1 threonine synthase [Gemmatimonadota bacterium]MBT5591939.1 threonine synthase [Gemmatimonadota bacterium]MBT5964689.1 threonine synthase [Gemmatimonadota bacterium]MBT6630338.1 threonine synthase [Gemmatimonadota bacterium]
MTSPFFTHLECTRTGTRYDRDGLHNLSDVGAPLFARYDLTAAAFTVSRDDLSRRHEGGMWRYREVMPLRPGDAAITLEEGSTPLRSCPRLAASLDLQQLWVKDESTNPTGSFKARGLSAAVTAAAARGATKLAIPTAGNAGGALAAYAAAAGLESYVFMPADTPQAFQLEVISCGGHLELVDGLISDCGRIVGERKQEEGWFDVSTLKEPYRVEGKKTMGYEMAEQFGWRLPDVVIYPTGGGTGLIGMWKAFEEMEKLGWLEPGQRPRMVSVQASGCAPVVRAFEAGEETATPWEDAQTCASGLRVPGAVGDFLMLRALRESQGTAVAVEDEELVADSHELARLTGIFPAPEGGATLTALRRLRDSGWVADDDRVVLFNTGSGYKYLEALSTKTP